MLRKHSLSLLVKSQLGVHVLTSLGAFRHSCGLLEESLHSCKQWLVKSCRSVVDLISNEHKPARAQMRMRFLLSSRTSAQSSAVWKATCWMGLWMLHPLTCNPDEVSLFTDPRSDVCSPAQGARGSDCWPLVNWIVPHFNKYAYLLSVSPRIRCYFLKGSMQQPTTICRLKIVIIWGDSVVAPLCVL